MIKLTPEATKEFLNKVNHLEGGNVEHVNFVLSDKGEEDVFLHYAEVSAYPEGAQVSCKIRMDNLMSFRFDAKCSSHYFGLSGYPNSLDIIWSNDFSSVVVAFGAIINELTYESLKQSKFWIESETVEYEIYEY